MPSIHRSKQFWLDFGERPAVACSATFIEVLEAARDDKQTTCREAYMHGEQWRRGRADAVSSAN
jgi:hypothetical protein